MTEVKKITLATVGRPGATAEELRRSAILAGAADLFFGQGFDAVSVDAIVARAGGSKTNVYRLFGNKDGLFETLIREECGRMTTPLRGMRGFAETAPDLATALATIGRAYLDVITDARSLSIHRLVIAQAQRFPQLGRVFQKAGPETANALIADAFSVLEARTLLDTAGDPRRTARRFMDLFRADLQMKLLLGVEDIPGPEKRDRLVDEACAAFQPFGGEGGTAMARHGAPRPEPAIAADPAPPMVSRPPDPLVTPEAGGPGARHPDRIAAEAAGVPFDDSLGDQLRATHRAVQGHLKGMIEPHGVTLGIWYFLRVLWRRDGLSQRELARAVGSMEPTTVSAIAAMERGGLVRRERDALDRRRQCVFLTPKGRALEAELVPVATEVVRDAAGDLAPAEMTRLLAQLRTIQANLAAHRPGEDLLVDGEP